MTDTFKSGQWRICSGCIVSIKPKDRVCILYDEIHCMACLTADEEKAADDLSRDGVDQYIVGNDSDGYYANFPTLEEVIKETEERTE